MAENGIQLRVEGVDRALADCRRILDAMGEKNAATAIARALNRAMEAARTESRAVAREAYTYAGKKKQVFRFQRANASNLHSVLTVTGGAGESLWHFKPSPKTPAGASRGGKRRLGVSVQVKRGGGRTTYSKAFVMQKRQGGFGIFERQNGKVRMLLGPSPIQALERRADQERVAEKASETFASRLRHEIDAILSGMAPGGR